MFFKVLVDAITPDARDCAYLIPDGWDDWFSFRTMFSLFVIDENGNRHQVGSVKIAHVGLQPASSGQPQRIGYRSPALQAEFDQLPPGYFSLGQGEDYYESLNRLSDQQKQKILTGLRDCAADLTLFATVRSEPATVQSLLRSVNASSVTGRLHRLTRGDAELTDFRFHYTLPPSQAPGGPPIPPPTMSFEVTPESEPPTNVHVLIGRNGVGKSRAMRGLIKALLNRHDEENDSGGQVGFDTQRPEEREFASLVLVSFSAFDDFDMVPAKSDAIPIQMVGLRSQGGSEDSAKATLKLSEALAVDFRTSLERCRTGLRMARWREAILTLGADDLFADANIVELIETEGAGWADTTESRFSKLSSGHAVVLLTITRLVELVDERTLVLIDEPEGHLHPPLLSAFIRSLSRLLISRNGVAIVATHSPVVLQEVPRSCAWKLRRTGRQSDVERPVIETFGENVGILTREVFGLEVTRTGFHRLLADAVFHQELGYDQIVEKFRSQLGAEARAIVKALVLERDSGR